MPGKTMTSAAVYQRLKKSDDGGKPSSCNPQASKVKDFSPQSREFAFVKEPFTRIQSAFLDNQEASGPSGPC